MNKLVKKIIIAILLVSSICCFNTTYVEATEANTGEVLTVGESTTIDMLTGSQTGADEKIKEVGNSFITILTTIGMIVSVIALIILGIKYMIGSVEEKAEYKSVLFPYFIGAILVFAASSIAQIIFNVATQL